MLLTILSWIGLVVDGLIWLMLLYIHIDERERHTPYSILVLSFFLIGAIESAAVIWWRGTLWMLIAAILGLAISAVFIATTVSDAVRKKTFRGAFYTPIVFGLFLIAISSLALLS